MNKPWVKKEKSDAKLFGGHRTPRSGGIWRFPGDAKSSQFLIDCKTTEAKSFSITRDMWKKITREALLNKRLPILSIKFVGGSEMVVLDKEDFLSLVKED